MNKNIKLFNSRYRQIVAIIFVLMAILAIRLFVVTVLQHDDWTAKASDQNTKTIQTSAPRGNIYDRNGNALALNKQVFTVNFNASALSTEEINSSSLKLINLLIKNGDKYTDNFPIKITDSGTYYYTYKEKIKTWLRKQGFADNLSAKEAFSKLCIKYKVDYSEANPEQRYTAMETLQTKYNLDPPISVKSMTYTYDNELAAFLEKFGFEKDEIKKGVSAKACFQKLRKNYEIDKSLSDKEARKIFIIRNEIATNGFTRYIPIKVASDISKKTIAYIEESGIPGLEVSSETKRYYPNKNTAAHIIGYMGSISESESKEYVEKGYSASDLIGKDGIEAALEEKLHGTPGIRKIKVNSSGEYVETLEETEAEKGSDVYLTIDLDLQKTAEQALKRAIASAANSSSGAAVAIDVETGDVLAMASFPDFDPNIFANGISTKAWESVQPENERDYLAPRPLMNNATRTSIAPGSTFKPITAIAALECGLDPNRYITDRGVIKYGDREFACSAWNDYGGTHGNENLEWGIGNSCNYYFFCIATGKDWGTGASLGYSQKITVDKILNTAKQFGLADKTGIEIGEFTNDLASEETKLETYEIGVENYLYINAHKLFPAAVVDDYDKLKKNMETISGWTKDNPDYEEVVQLLKEKTDVKKDQIENVASTVKFDYFIQAQWTTGDQFNLSIGQGDNAYTPLQMANYVATLGNNGVRNQVSVVAGVEGEGATKKDKATDLNLKAGTLDEVIKGMKRVCSSGTLSGVFGNFPVEVAGKTGTAEYQAIKQPASEVKYVKNRLGTLNAAAGTSVTWSKVKKTMEKMMEEEPERYSTEDKTVDDAVIKASNYKITQGMIDSGKGGYDYNAWTIAMAPADNPKIAVAVLLIQGGYSSSAAPVAKDIIADYLNVYGDKKVKTTKTDIDGTNKVQ